MLRFLLILCAFSSAAAGFAAAQAQVRVEPAHLEGPRPLGKQTQAAAIRDYLQSWQSFKSAFAQNRAALLDADFVGDAHGKLAAAIQEQTALGIRTRYQDRAHDIRIVFYSPEGLSIELTDTVEYGMQVLDHERPVAEQEEHARYIVVLTPSEVRWRVRVFQADPE
ncbi:MAG: hypothetical protein ACRD3N_18910 [Terracidiphilus sp.]